MTTGNYGGPDYGPPGYGPPGHGPPGHGPPSGPYIGAGPRPTFGALGAVIAIAGAIAVVLAYTALDWFDGGSSSTFSDVHDVVTAAPSHAVTGLAAAYFGWLAWLLLCGSVIVAIAANAASNASAVVRAAGVLVGAVSAVVTLFAIKLDGTGSRSLSDYLHHARVGFYLALAGFLLLAVGAAIGPRRRS